MRKSKLWLIIAILLSLSLVAAACGDDDDTTASDDGSSADDGDGGDQPSDDGGDADDGADGSDDGGATDDGEPADDGGEDPVAAGVQRATEFIQPYLDTPSSINITEPLPERPAEGVSVYWAECNFATCSTIGDGIEAATELLGWDLERAVYNPGNPEEVGSVHLQGIQSGADVLMTSGRPRSEWEAAAEAGMGAGIPIVDSYSANEVGLDENGVWGCFGCLNDSEVAMTLITNYLIQDSGGNATIIYSSIPDFPVIAFRDEVTRRVLEENCPDCTLVEVQHSVQNLLEGAIPNTLISAIQDNQDAENLYVMFSFGEQAFGFTAAVQEVGLLDAVKIVGHEPTVESLENLDAGLEDAWTGNPVFQAGFTMVDCYARIAQGVECPPDTLLPTQVLTPGSEGLQLALDFQAERGVASPFVGDPDFITKFEELWQLN